MAKASYIDEDAWVLLVDGELEKLCRDEEHAKNLVADYESLGHNVTYAQATVTWEVEEEEPVEEDNA